MKASISGNKLIIEVELGAPTPSSSGKSYVVASTGGFVAVDGGLKVNVSAITKDKAWQPPKAKA